MTPYPKLVQLRPKDPLPMPLLLLADETAEAIQRYIDKCDTYVLIQHDAVVGVIAIHPNSSEELEIKNIAIIESLQGIGLGTYILNQAEHIARAANYLRLIVGTATVGRQLDFYRKNGFVEIGLRKNFFLENYPKPIFEGDQQLCDMVLLEKKL